ncbi:uncharacterized protein MELLADRAFT_94626 [Melampsora larici-populina 98AG31]|uniref:Uncharacterized protein n=1 Tax=Melampsora larici-populina (strain 98AG31 / pathotype 3-4-7) TaxID=747676 RepID=F4S7D3_MELLP|nr:uncharacterized protein MELLADRAFT_94626 [Melampsora larici-populina 98AG31]EGF99386.1 hypothetical protein MELLADRAFT_94626 [Melampsora larici-populina 98AG31]
MAALHQQSPLEHQQYSDQSYEDLIHQPFQRPTTDHNGSIYSQNIHNSFNLGNRVTPLNQNQADINQINYVQEAQCAPIDFNQDHQLPQPPLVDNRPCINQNNINQNIQLQHTQTLPNTSINQNIQLQQVQIVPNQFNSLLNIDQNHQISVPHSHRASAPIAPIAISSSLNRQSESEPLGLTKTTTSDSIGISTVSQPAGKKASQTKKSASRSKSSTQTKPNKDSNCEEEVTKSNKALLDEFLTPAQRLPDNISLPADLTVTELYALDASQLRTLADQHTRGRGHGAPSLQKRQILRDFHNSTEKLLAILCIHLGISQDVASNEIGKCASFRASRNYDYFIKSKAVSDIYRQTKFLLWTDGGPLNPVSREQVRELWASYTKEEQDQFRKAGEACDIGDIDDIDNIEPEDNIDNIDNIDGVNPDVIPDNRPTHKGLLKIVRGSNDEETRKNGFRTKSRDLAHSKIKCDEFVASFIQKANNMSRIHPAQFTITAVSTHLSKHCFQYMSTTPGLWEWVDHDINSSPTHESTTSKMQAFLTGKTVAGLARPKRANGSRVELEKLKATLNQIIRKATEAANKPQEAWTWSNCEARLAEQGFKLQYEPSDPLYKFWITNPNSAVTEEKARQINIDLVTHPVSLTPIPGFVFKYKSGRNNKRKRDVGLDEEEERIGDVNLNINDSNSN